MFWHRTAIKLHRLNVPICISRCCMHLYTNSRGTFLSLFIPLFLTHSLFLLPLCKTQLPLPNANSSQEWVNKKTTATCIHTQEKLAFPWLLISWKKYEHAIKMRFDLVINKTAHSCCCIVKRKHHHHHHRCSNTTSDQLTNQCHISNENILSTHIHIHMYLSFTSFYVCHRGRLHRRRCQWYCRLISLC